jgi:hypothetical protein
MPAFGLTKARGRAVPKGWIGSVAGPTSYATGGFTVTIEDLSRIEDAVVIAGGGYLAEVASISGNTVTIVVRYFDYAATAAGTAIEVPSGTDLSGVTFRIIAIGE